MVLDHACCVVVFIKLEFWFSYVVQFPLQLQLSMALTIRVVDLFLLSLIIFLVIQEYSQKIDAQVLMLQAPLLIQRKFDKIYQFRESLSDTGNFIRESLIGAQSIYARLPYGMDFQGDLLDVVLTAYS